MKGFQALVISVLLAVPLAASADPAKNDRKPASTVAAKPSQMSLLYSKPDWHHNGQAFSLLKKDSKAKQGWVWWIGKDGTYLDGREKFWFLSNHARGVPPSLKGSVFFNDYAGSPFP